MNDDCYQLNVLKLSYNYLYQKLCALLILKRKTIEQVAENSTFSIANWLVFLWIRIWSRSVSMQ